MLNKNLKICIVGLGLLGASYAKGLSLEGYSVSGIDISDETIEYCLDNQYINVGSKDVKIVKDADIVIFALYPNVLINWLKNNQQYFKSGTIITDVTGVKSSLIKEIASFIRNDIEFIGSHPMAGRETSGPIEANVEMFKDANFIITPYNSSDKAKMIVRELANTLHFGHISELSPEKHDEMIGFVSQLTHVIAVCLMNTSDNGHLKEYTGDSFRDLTRIAKINEKLWTELFISNKANLVKEIEMFDKTLMNFKNILENEDTNTMMELFKQSTKRRKEFDKV